GGIDVQLGFLGVCQKSRVARGLLECLAQDVQSIERYTGRSGERPAEQFCVEVELKHAPVLTGLEEVVDAGDGTKGLGCPGAHLNDELEAALRHIVWPKRSDVCAHETAHGLSLVPFHGEIGLTDALIAGNDADF